MFILHNLNMEILTMFVLFIRFYFTKCRHKRNITLIIILLMNKKFNNKDKIQYFGHIIKGVRYNLLQLF